jgi:hypothetical protein
MRGPRLEHLLALPPPKEEINALIERCCKKNGFLNLQMKRRDRRLKEE